MHRRILPVLFYLLFLPWQARAYDTGTHAYLTSKILDVYNTDFPQNKLDDGLRSYIVDGARREDDQFRPLNHFYDPVYDRGFTSGLLGNWNKSPDWARSESLQNQAKYKVAATIASILTAAEEKNINLVSSDTDYTWDRGLRAYANGNLPQAVFILGHILHLIEDLSVPDHTRNDAHPGNSPYENWTSKFSLETPDKSLDSAVKYANPILVDTLGGYFKGMAMYSNNNFYSQNTIGIQSGYSKPQPDSYASNGNLTNALNSEEGIILFRQPNTGGILVRTQRDVILDDKQVLQSYWSHLALKAIQYGAGAVRLFVQEGEKAKNDSKFAKTEPKSFLGRIADVIGGIFSGPKNNSPVDVHTQVKNELSTPDNAGPVLADEISKETSESKMSNKEDEYSVIPVNDAKGEATTTGPSGVDNSSPENDPPRPQIAIMDPSMTPVSVYIPATPPEDNTAHLQTAALNEPPVEISTSTDFSVSSSTEQVSTSTPTENGTTSVENVMHSILSFTATTTSTSTLHMEWFLDGAATSSIVDVSASSTLIYLGTSTSFDFDSSRIFGDKIFSLAADFGDQIVIATTSLTLVPESPPAPTPGTVENLQWTTDPVTRTLRFTARIWSMNPENTSRLDLKFRKSTSPLDGPMDFVSEFAKNGEEVSITIPTLADGQYHWTARVADLGSSSSAWQSDGEAEIIIPRALAVASGTWNTSDFPNGYCNFGKAEVSPVEDREISSVEFWALCVNGDCMPPNTFQIYDATGTTLLAESDGNSVHFGYPDPIWVWETFTGTNRITLKAGETYHVTPHSYHGTCMVNPAFPNAGAFTIR